MALHGSKPQQKNANFPDNSITAACINQTTAENKFHPRLPVFLRFFSALWVNEKCVSSSYFSSREIFSFAEIYS
jgi:hypothetical protein